MTTKGILLILAISLLSDCSERASTSSQVNKFYRESDQQAQTAKTTNSQNDSDSFPKTIFKINKIGGWKLPDVSTYGVETPRHVRFLKIDGKSVQVYETKYKPSQGVIINTDEYYLLDQKTVQIKAATWGISSIRKFEIDDRTFCYIFRGTLMSSDSNNKFVALGSVINLSFYDEDGDGSMELLEYASIYPEIPSRVPQWASKIPK